MKYLPSLSLAICLFTMISCNRVTTYYDVFQNESGKDVQIKLLFFDDSTNRAYDVKNGSSLNISLQVYEDLKLEETCPLKSDLLEECLITLDDSTYFLLEVKDRLTWGLTSSNHPLNRTTKEHFTCTCTFK